MTMNELHERISTETHTIGSAKISPKTLHRKIDLTADKAEKYKPVFFSYSDIHFYRNRSKSKCQALLLLNIKISMQSDILNIYRHILRAKFLRETRTSISTRVNNPDTPTLSTLRFLNIHKCLTTRSWSRASKVFV